MEGFDWSQLLDVLIPAAGGVVVAVVAWLVLKVKSLVAATENKWDDELLAKVLEGMKKGDESE